MSKARTPLKMPEKRAQEAEAWVQAAREPEAMPTVSRPLPRQALGEKPARLNVDMPAELHRRFKTACAGQGVKMAEVVIQLVEGWITTGQK